MKAKRQKIAQTTQGKTTDYTDPRNPYINQHKKQTSTRKLLNQVWDGYIIPHCK
jgi:hypothetical protein